MINLRNIGLISKLALLKSLINLGDNLEPILNICLLSGKINIIGILMKNVFSEINFCS